MASKGTNVYKLRPRHLISAVHAQKRKTLCNGLRKKYRVADIPNFVFCDEMYVVAGETGNHQNDRCFGKSWELISDDRKFKNKKKSPLRAMVFAAVWRDGRSRLIVLKSGFRLNQTTYIETCLKPLIEDVSPNMKTDLAILYQDKAPCHTGKKTQRFLEEHACSFVPAHIVPPSSSDLNVMEYRIWPYMKQKLNGVKNIKNFNDLKAALEKIWRQMPQEIARDGCCDWLLRVRRIIKANVSHIYK